MKILLVKLLERAVSGEPRDTALSPWKSSRFSKSASPQIHQPTRQHSLQLLLVWVQSAGSLGTTICMKMLLSKLICW